MTPAELIIGALATVGSILGGISAYRSSRGTEKKTVADVYGEALDRLDKRLAAAEQRGDRLELRVNELEAALTTEREHSAQQDARLGRLRHIVSAWAQWGAQLQAEWHTVRQSPDAPPLPHVNAEAEERTR